MPNWCIYDAISMYPQFIPSTDNASFWLARNSDDLSAVIAAIAGAAGPNNQNPVLDDTGNAFPGMAQSLELAASRLAELASKMMPKPAPPPGLTISGPFLMTGLWLYSSAASNGEVPWWISSEVSKFLFFNNLPVVVEEGSGIGSALAAQMFTPATQSPFGPPFFSPPEIEIDVMGSHGFRIFGQQIYYSIPLGLNSVEHSSTVLYLESKGGTENSLPAKLSPHTELKDGVHCLATLQAVWQTPEGAADIMKNAVKQMTADGTFELMAPWCGWAVGFLYKFAAPVTVGREEVLQTFYSAISASMGAGSMLMPEIELLRYDTIVP
jgi:hypothetical protein